MMQYACVSCNKRYASFRYRCECGAPLEIRYDLKKISVSKKKLRSRDFNHWRYSELYPVEKLVSISEGGTRLLNSEQLGDSVGIKNLLVKEEFSNPTGSFKDRGSSVEISFALKLGVESACVASTGNMGASCSAYSRKAGIKCYVFVPKEISHSVKIQIGIYGSRLIEVEGDYDFCSELAKKASSEFGMHLLGDFALRKEGQKSVGFEIVDQLDFKSPDWILVPIGNGTLISSIWKGLNEFKKLGLIKNLPRLGGFQSSGACPLINALESGEIKPVIAKTVAHAIAVGNPSEGLSALKAIKNSKGVLRAISDEKMLGSQKLIARKEGLYVQPSAAITIAALRDLLEEGIISRDETVCCVLTGHGLKRPEPVSVRTSKIISKFSELKNAGYKG